MNTNNTFAVALADHLNKSKGLAWRNEVILALRGLDMSDHIRLNMSNRFQELINLMDPDFPGYEVGAAEVAHLMAMTIIEVLSGK